MGNKFIILFVISSIILLAVLFVFIIKPELIKKPDQVTSSPPASPSLNPLIKTTEGVVVKVEGSAIYVKENSGQQIKLEIDQSTKIILQTISTSKTVKQATGAAILLNTIKSEKDYEYDKIKVNDKVRVILYEQDNQPRVQSIIVFKEVK